MLIKRSHLVALGVVGLVVVLAIGFGVPQLVGQRDTISNLTRSVSELKASMTKLREPQSTETGKLKTEVNSLLSSVDVLKNVVGTTSIGNETLTGWAKSLQIQIISLQGNAGAQPQASTLNTLQSDATSLQNQIDTLNSRIGTGPASPDISSLLDQVTNVVTCLRQNESNEAAGSC